MTDMTKTTTTSLVRRLLGPTQSIETGSVAPDLTIRLAVPADVEELDRLAQLDSTRAPRGLVLVAEVDGRIWAAISVDDQHSVADPFRPTGELLALLVARARQLRRGRRGGTRRFPRVWPETGYDRAAIS
jgi:hypothetical protein